MKKRSLHEVSKHFEELFAVPNVKKYYEESTPLYRFSLFVN
jgi:hypothetical protein